MNINVADGTMENIELNADELATMVIALKDYAIKNEFNIGQYMRIKVTLEKFNIYI
ncbi:hypothetical protein [Clostridium sp.]|uniref:hypothetical protein n=1 Tax=Clostridium sp. TaxID=1506 RepID=UPI002635A31F|nr:hypothetical protein [Clostridium sp.]